MYSLDTRIDELIFHRGCSTIPNALKRTGCTTLGEVVKYMENGNNWPMVGAIRMRLIRNWLKKEVAIS